MGHAAAEETNARIKDAQANTKQMRQAILLVSAGREIAGIRTAVENRFPEYEVRSISTIPPGREPLETALEQAAADGITKLVVQPVYLAEGYEYACLSEKLNACAAYFKEAALARPLLSGAADRKTVASALAEELSVYDDGATAVLCMAHGTEKAGNSLYYEFQKVLEANVRLPVYLGVLKGEPSLEAVLCKLKEDGLKTENSACKRIVLRPLMVSAGRHVLRDMAGDGANSWKKRLEAEGFSVECIVKGLAELTQVQALYTAHTKEEAERQE